MTTTRIYIYDISKMVFIVESSDPKVAWDNACREVRFLARSRNDQRCVTQGWYQTANRVGFSCGSFRAITEMAEIRPRGEFF